MESLDSGGARAAWVSGGLARRMAGGGIPARDTPVSELSDDLALVERMLAGEESAFDAFAERCLPPLYRFASACLRGDRELTLDTVQTALARAIPKLDTYRGDAPLVAWLCACCRNEILMRARRLASAPAEVGLDDGLEGRLEPAAGFHTPGAGAEEALLRAEEAARVHAALDLLPERYARALEWKYLERLPVREIAARLELSEKATESLLTRARNAFRSGYRGLEAGLASGPRAVGRKGAET